jgi:hypothetical protein
MIRRSRGRRSSMEEKKRNGQKNGKEKEEREELRTENYENSE